MTKAGWHGEVRPAESALVSATAWSAAADQAVGHACAASLSLVKLPDVRGTACTAPLTLCRCHACPAVTRRLIAEFARRPAHVGCPYQSPMWLRPLVALASAAVPPGIAVHALDPSHLNPAGGPAGLTGEA